MLYYEIWPSEVNVNNRGTVACDDGILPDIGPDPTLTVMDLLAGSGHEMVHTRMESPVSADLPA